jgi:hypothetical protein
VLPFHHPFRLQSIKKEGSRIMRTGIEAALVLCMALALAACTSEGDDSGGSPDTDTDSDTDSDTDTDTGVPPDEICEAPALADVSSPTSVVGDGTAASCTAEALQVAAKSGGVITFDCGAEPVTITVASQIVFTLETVLDGNDLVTLRPDYPAAHCTAAHIPGRGEPGGRRRHCRGWWRDLSRWRQPHRDRLCLL